MRRTSLVLLTTVILVTTGCHTVQPEGTTKAILTGDVFSGTKHHDPGSVGYTEVEKEVKPPVRWKMEF
ncbi:hypothetical protein BH11VER1_BH11VER1_13790 [soil metagenome]